MEGLSNFAFLGFGFVYFDRAEDAVKAKEYATDTAMGKKTNS